MKKGDDTEIRKLTEKVYDAVPSKLDRQKEFTLRYIKYKGDMTKLKEFFFEEEIKQFTSNIEFKQYIQDREVTELEGELANNNLLKGELMKIIKNPDSSELAVLRAIELAQKLIIDDQLKDRINDIENYNLPLFPDVAYPENEIEDIDIDEIQENDSSK